MDQGPRKILIYLDQYKSIFLGQIIGKSIFLQFLIQCNNTTMGKIKILIWAEQHKFGQPELSASFGKLDNSTNRKPCSLGSYGR